MMLAELTYGGNTTAVPNPGCRMDGECLTPASAVKALWIKLHRQRGSKAKLC